MHIQSGNLRHGWYLQPAARMLSGSPSLALANAIAARMLSGRKPES
jgi:hypothetical protein